MRAKDSPSLKETALIIIVMTGGDKYYKGDQALCAKMFFFISEELYPF